MAKRALVIGGGIAGIQAALDIANSGYEVILVEKEPSIGGHMAQLSETFPTLDCSQCILTPRTVEVGHHENIRLYTYSEVESISRIGEEDAGDSDGIGSAAGDFKVAIRRRAAYVNWETCTGCGVCQEKCPFKTESAFERGIGQRKVIYTLSPQAVPNKPVIDAEHCVYLQSMRNGKVRQDIESGRTPAVAEQKVPNAKGAPAKPRCGACAKFCPTGAIDFEQQDRLIEETVSAVVLATGYDLYPAVKIPEYCGTGVSGGTGSAGRTGGSGRLPDVIDELAFERLLAASGPTGGKVLRPSDGKTPREVVFVQCCGSRDPARGVPYCSKICCMVTAKQAILYKHRVHDGQAYIFYIDVRAGGKGYEEFLNRAQVEDVGSGSSGVIYLRGKVSKLYSDNGKIIVKGVDTLSGRTVEIAADLVVLATAVVPGAGSAHLAGLMGLEVDENGFFTGCNEELDPLSSSIPGVFLAGAALGPKDIPETVAQASGAAAKVLTLFRQQGFKDPHPPTSSPSPKPPGKGEQKSRGTGGMETHE